eukprot:4595294-Prymnesium_polylepis.1
MKREKEALRTREVGALCHAREGVQRKGGRAAQGRAWKPCNVREGVNGCDAREGGEVVHTEGGTHATQVWKPCNARECGRPAHSPHRITHCALSGVGPAPNAAGPTRHTPHERCTRTACRMRVHTPHAPHARHRVCRRAAACAAARLIAVCPSKSSCLGEPSGNSSRLSPRPL